VKQLLQSLKTGVVTAVDVPVPSVRPGHLLVRTRLSLISSGTERMLTEFGKAGLIGKVRQQPDKVRDVVQKMKTDGVLATLDAVRAKLDQPIPLGYCNVGVVEAVGAGVAGFAVGDRVLSNGPHADYVVVPQTLAAAIPDGVSDETAVFGVLGAIALQGIRLAQPTLGESFAVIGLGVIGLLAVQLLRANGCRVVGIDPNPARLALARAFGAATIEAGGATDIVAAAVTFARGRGVDGVLFTAATDASEPMREAARMCRQRGRIVLVGVSGLDLSRADFYEKEISFQVSCSYGPGRYDPSYEEQARDYPFGFVRWTEQRNFEAVLDAMASGALDPTMLVSARFAMEDATDAYARLSDPTALGLLLSYPEAAAAASTTIVRHAVRGTAGRGGTVGIIGAGNYASRVLAPAFRAAGAEIAMIAASGGINAAIMAERSDAAAVTTDAAAMIADPAIGTIVVATPHASHARYVIAALAAGKNVFVEKPLAIDVSDVAAIEAVCGDGGSLLTVGFNRRFSPFVAALKARLSSAPKSVLLTMNAGAVPGKHWTQDPAIGGGRIVGEACHYIDLARYIVGHPIVAMTPELLGVRDGVSNFGDTAIITLRFADGSVAAVHYFANGNKGFAKERIEVFDAGRTHVVDNFRRLSSYGMRASSLSRLRPDKGQGALVARFVAAVRSGGEPPIPVAELFEVARVSIAAGNGVAWRA
jgi:predicted dehydrogenase